MHITARCFPDGIMQIKELKAYLSMLLTAAIGYKIASGEWKLEGNYAPRKV